MRPALQTFLMDKLTPLGQIIYGARLAYWESLQANIQRKDPTHPALHEALHKCAELRRVLTRQH